MGDRRGNPSWGRLVVGLALLIVGALLLVERTDLGLDFEPGRWWPVVVVLVGLVHVGTAEGRRGRRAGLVVTGIGVWLLLAHTGLLGFDWSNSWPLAIFAVGLASLLQPDTREDLASGATLVGVAAVLLVMTHGWFGLDWSTGWPLLMIVAGIAILGGAIRAGRVAR